MDNSTWYQERFCDRFNHTHGPEGISACMLDNLTTFRATGHFRDPLTREHLVEIATAFPPELGKPSNASIPRLASAPPSSRWQVAVTTTTGPRQVILLRPGREGELEVLLALAPEEATRLAQDLRTAIDDPTAPRPRRKSR